MTDYHTTVQYQLRMPAYLREQIKDSAKDNNRSMNQDIISRLEDSFMQEEAEQHIETIKQNFTKIKVFDLGKGVKRVVYGNMLNAFDVDYTADMRDIKQQLEELIEAIKLSADLNKRFLLENKDVLVYKGGHHIDIVEKGFGSLDWIRVEDLPTTLKSLSSY